MSSADEALRAIVREEIERLGALGDRWLRVKDAATYGSVSVRQVQRWCASGLVESRGEGSGRRVLRSSVAEALRTLGRSKEQRAADKIRARAA